VRDLWTLQAFNRHDRRAVSNDLRDRAARRARRPTARVAAIAIGRGAAAADRGPAQGEPTRTGMVWGSERDV